MVKLTIFTTEPAPDWHQQYGRMMRWYKKYKNLSRRRVNIDTIYCEDVIHTFFINCYHLKDWLANEDGINLKSEIEEAMNKSDAMVLCDCLANGTKHKSIHTSTRRQKIKSIELKSVPSITLVAGGENKSTGKNNWCVVVDDKTQVDGMQLATDCIEFWQSFLKSKQLL